MNTDRHGNRESTCRFCDKRITGSHGRHLAHFDPGDNCVQTCVKAPEATLIHVNDILREQKTRREAKKRVAEVAQLAAADRVVRKQMRIDHQCNSFAGEEVDDKLCRAIVSAGLPFAMIDNPEVRAWSRARGLASSTYKDPGRKRLAGTLLTRNHDKLEADMNIRDARTNKEVGYTVNIDAGEDTYRRDIVSCMTVNPEGERSVELIDCCGVSRTATWYAQKIFDIMQKSQGGPEMCFHVCIDAGTPGVHCSNPRAIEDELRSLGPHWVSVTVCQFHQGSLLVKSIFKIDEYATASARAREIKHWVRKHHFAHGQYRKAGGKHLLMPAATRALKDPMHCLNLVENKGPLLSVFACDAFDLWVLKQNRSGEKGRAAVEEAQRFQSYIDDDSFWAILTEAYKVPLTPRPCP